MTRVRVLRVRVRVLTKGLESESLKIWIRVRLEYTVGLEYYITAKLQSNNLLVSNDVNATSVADVYISTV